MFPVYFWKASHLPIDDLLEVLDEAVIYLYEIVQFLKSCS